MQPLRPQAAQPSMGALGSAAFQALAAADVAPEADFFQKYQVQTLCALRALKALALVWQAFWSGDPRPGRSTAQKTLIGRTPGSISVPYPEWEPVVVCSQCRFIVRVSQDMKFLIFVVQALRAQRMSEQQSKKKRKRADDDEDASTTDEMSDSDDAVGAPPPNAPYIASSHMNHLHVHEAFQILAFYVQAATSMAVLCLAYGSSHRCRR